MGSIPFTFYVSDSVATKWNSKPIGEQWALFQCFLTCDLQAHGEIRSKQTARCMVAGGFELASVAAKENLITVTRLSQVMGDWVTAQMRKSAPVKGEVELTAEWAKLTGLRYQLEVPCSAGRVDVLIPDRHLIVEAKLAGEWKHALGQVIAYRYSLAQNHSIALLLLGHTVIPAEVSMCCRSVGCDVFQYNGNGKICTVANLALNH